MNEELRRLARLFPQDKPLYAVGGCVRDMLMGREGSEAKRKKLLKKLSLPEMLSVTCLLEVLNSMYSLDEYKNALKEIE